jgi:hypothetical protein
MPVTELDRYVPVPARQMQHYERTPPGAPATREALEAHAALPPDHHSYEAWEPQWPTDDEGYQIDGTP